MTEPSEPFRPPIDALLAAGVEPPPAFKSVTSDLLDQALSVPRVHRTVEEVWVAEPGTLHGGHWEKVGEV
jgi:hypothetical protein